jgi:hypothetical protein
LTDPLASGVCGWEDWSEHLRPDASERQEASEADSFDGSNWPLRGVAALSPA